MLRGEAVAKCVGGDSLTETGACASIAAGLLDAARGDVLRGFPGGEEILALRFYGAPVGAEEFEQAWGKHGVAVFVALALLDADKPIFRVDVRDFDGDGLADAESRAVAEHEDGAVF